jgi:LPXTG-motif cell wall-anchored protein
MDLKLFSIFTIIGGGIWLVMLVMIGYLIGDNEAVIGSYLQQMQWFIIGGIILVIAFYIWWKRKK